MAANSATEQVGTAEAAFIYNDWYPVLRTDRLHGRRMTTAQALGLPLVLGRKADGALFAMRDTCPHRGMPLSAGWFDGSCVTCRYHGWKFEPAGGQCLEIPSVLPDSTLPHKVFATTYPCREQDGYAWVYFPRPGTGRLREEAAAALPAPPEVPKFSSRYRTAHLWADLPLNIDQGIIGLMDPAHGPFVHQSWWWRSQKSIHEKQKRFEPIPQGFRMSAHKPSTNSAPYKLLGVYGQPIETTIDFVLPNRRYELLRCGSRWFSSLTTVTPIDANSCRIDICGAWNIFRMIPFAPAIAKFFGRKFVRQDQHTMTQQAVGLKSHPSLMLIDDADRPAKWYFALKRARLDADETGRPFVHPIDGPVVLHWRS